MTDVACVCSMGPFAAVSNESMIRGLVPLDKALTSARNDAKETCAAIQGVSVVLYITR